MPVNYLKELFEDLRSTLHMAKWYWNSIRLRRGKNFCKECKYDIPPWQSECPYDFVKNNIINDIRCCEKFTER